MCCVLFVLSCVFAVSRFAMLICAGFHVALSVGRAKDVS